MLRAGNILATDSWLHCYFWFMQQGIVWMNAWVFHLVCLEGKIYGVQQLCEQWLPGARNNQSAWGRRYGSISTSDVCIIWCWCVFIAVNPKLRSNYSRLQPVKYIHFTHSCSVNAYMQSALFRKSIFWELTSMLQRERYEVIFSLNWWCYSHKSVCWDITQHQLITWVIFTENSASSNFNHKTHLHTE